MNMFLYKTFKNNKGEYTHYTIETFKSQEEMNKMLNCTSKYYEYSKNLVNLNLQEQEDFVVYIITKHKPESFALVKDCLQRYYSTVKHLISNEAIVKALESIYKVHSLTDITPPVKKTISFKKK